MQCEKAHELMSDYVGGTLDRALSVTVDNHVEECASCREEAAGLRRVWANLDELRVVEPPPYLHENIMSRLEVVLREEEEQAARSRAVWDWRALFRPRQMAFAATALVLLLGGAELVQTQRAELGPVGAIVQWLHPAPVAPLALKTAQADWVTQSDGTTALVVHLRPASTLDASAAQVGFKLQATSAQPGGTTVTLAEGTLNAGEDKAISIPADVAPAERNITLSVALSALDANGKPQTTGAKTLPVPFAAH